MKRSKHIVLMLCITAFFISAELTGCKREKGSLTKDNGTVLSDQNSGTGEKGLKSGSIKKKFFGTYRIRLTGFTGVLKIFPGSGELKGSIQFSSWGRGKEQPLKKVSIKGKKIYFIRSVSTREELAEYGGSRYFKQEFYGTFSDDGSSVKGYFKDSGAQNSWDGKK